jgi:hypothetical protein
MNSYLRSLVLIVAANVCMFGDVLATSSAPSVDGVDSRLNAMARGQKDADARQAIRSFIKNGSAKEKSDFLEGRYSIPFESPSKKRSTQPAQCNPPVVGCGSCKRHCTVTVICENGPGDINKCRTVRECTNNCDL